MMCDVRFAIYDLRLHTATPHCALLVRGYWNFAPSGLLKESLNFLVS